MCYASRCGQVSSNASAAERDGSPAVRHSARPLVACLAPALLALLLGVAGCSSASDAWYGDTSGEEWHQQGDACVRVSEERPLRRVTNYADPELCDRTPTRRQRVYVRVPPPEERADD